MAKYAIRHFVRRQVVEEETGDIIDSQWFDNLREATASTDPLPRGLFYELEAVRHTGNKTEGLVEEVVSEDFEHYENGDPVPAFIREG